MTQEITYNDLYNLYGASNATINSLMEKKMKAHGKFLNFLFVNKERAYKILTEFEKDRPKPGEEVKAFYQKANELHGTLKKIEGETDEMFAVREKEAHEKENVLREEYKESIAEWDELQKGFEAKLNNKVKFNSCQLEKAYLPGEMDANVMEALYKFIINN
jgi:DNA repair ATPase RecN